MTSRIAAVVLGIIAGIAAGLFLAFDWNAAMAMPGIDEKLVSALSDPSSRLIWTIAAAVTAFAVTSLLVALVGGLIEVLIARSRIDGLRYDPGLAGRWSAIDWHAAFADTAVADRAEAIVTALLPAVDSIDAIDRRVLADPFLLLDLDRIWLARLSLAGTIAPLPVLLVGLGALFALLRYILSGSGWEIPLAAGLAGGLVITIAYYFVRLILAFAIELAVRAATAAVRPLTPAFAHSLLTRAAGEPFIEPAVATAERGPQPDAGRAVIAELRDALAGPLAQIADAADRLSAAGAGLSDKLPAEITILAARLSESENVAQQREQTIDDALAEVRAGIERILAQSATPSGADIDALAETARLAITGQNETLRQASQELKQGIDRVVGSLVATIDAVWSAGPTDATAPSAGQPRSPAIADALKNLLREFDEN